MRQASSILPLRCRLNANAISQKQIGSLAGSKAAGFQFVRTYLPFISPFQPFIRNECHQSRSRR